MKWSTKAPEPKKRRLTEGGRKEIGVWSMAIMKWYDIPLNAHPSQP